MTSEGAREDLLARLRTAERENRILKSRLERSEAHRRGLEGLKERQESLLRQQLNELAAAKDSIAHANSVLEQRVTQRTQALSTANIALTQARDAALAASRAKSVFLATMSHELRTPLNAIIGYGELLSEVLRAGVTNGPAADEQMQLILQAGYHLLELISDILELARIESGATDLRIEQIPLRLFLRDLTHLFRPQAKRRQNSVQLHLNDAPRSFFSDRTKLRQVLHNLMSNAIKFTQGGTIVLEVHCLPAGVEIAVRDSGIGIRAEDYELLFQPFMQVDGSSTRRFGGSGLGLTITRSFCHLLGGDIEVESEVGAGSSFRVSLPFCPPKAPALVEDDDKGSNANRDQGAASVHERIEPIHLGPRKGPVVIIDDDPTAHAPLCALFGEGITTICETSVELGLACVRKFQPRVVIVDVLSHCQTGLQVLEDLGKLPDDSRPQIVVLTEFCEVDLCLQLGATKVLRRPTTRQKMTAAIASVCTA